MSVGRKSRVQAARMYLGCIDSLVYHLSSHTFVPYNTFPIGSDSSPPPPFHSSCKRQEDDIKRTADLYTLCDKDRPDPSEGMLWLHLLSHVGSGTASNISHFQQEIHSGVISPVHCPVHWIHSNHSRCTSLWSGDEGFSLLQDVNVETETF